MNDTKTSAVARTYVEAVGLRDLSPLATLLDEGLVATFAGAQLDKRGWLGALERLLPAVIRNDIREIFVAGDRACVVYDFVTDTPAGAVVCVELLTVHNGRITDIELVLDQATFEPVHTALRERAARR